MQSVFPGVLVRGWLPQTFLPCVNKRQKFNYTRLLYQCSGRNKSDIGSLVGSDPTLAWPLTRSGTAIRITVRSDFHTCEGRFPLRKITIGSDFFHLVLSAPPDQKKVENTSTLLSSGLRIIGSNWNRKLVPKAHARVQFCSDPVRSHAYFPLWKPALGDL